MTSALLVKTNGEVRHIELPVTDAHLTIHEMVGGWFDVVKHRGQPNMHAYVHDEGLLRKMEPNVAVCYLFEQLIVGDVIISRSTKDGSETDFAIDEETVEIYKLLNTDETKKEYLREFASKIPTDWKIYFGD